MRRVLTTSLRTSLCLAILLSCSLSAGAEDLQVTNASFENVPVPAGTFPVFLPFGWSHYDPQNLLDGSVDAVGVLNPTGTTFFPAGAPDGDNVALVYLAGDVGQGAVGIEQAIDYSLSPETTYTLRVMVGNIASGSGNPPITDFFNLSGFPGYAVQLLAGTTVVAEDMNSLGGSIAEGTFAESVVSLTVGAAHPNLNETLTIRLLNLNQAGTPAAPGIEVDFDNVRLTAVSAVPEPRTYVLIAVGFFVLLVGGRRRRSVAIARFQGRHDAA